MATSVVATATSTVGTITIPSSGAAAGDIAILFDSSRDSGSGSDIPTKVIPAGWTELATDTGTANGGNGFRTTICCKVLAGGDLGASITGQNANANAKQMLVLRTDFPVSGATAGTLNYQVTTGNPTLQTVTPPTTAYPVLVVGGFHVNAAGTFAISPSGTALSASAAGAINYAVYDSGAVSTTYDHNDNSSNWNVLWSTAIKLTVALSLTAAAANFTGTGQDAGVKAGRRLIAAAQAMTITGQAATLTYTQMGLLAADPGAFALTGQAAGGLRGLRLIADAGAFALAGQDAGLLYGRRVAGDAGAFALAGLDAALLYGRLLAADPGAYALTGLDAALVSTQVTLPVLRNAVRARIGLIADRHADILSAPAVTAAYAVRLTLADRTLRYLAGYGEITIDGETFLGVTDPDGGRAVRIGAIDDPRPGTAATVEIGLSNIDDTFARSVRRDAAAMEGRPADLLLLVWDPNRGTPTGMAIPLLRWGRMTAPTIDYPQPGVQEVTLTIEGQFSGRNFAVGGIYSDADQQRRFPGDDIFALLGLSTNVRWPAS